MCLKLLAGLYCAMLSTALQCIGEYNTPEHFWAAFKYPQGFNYAYYTPTSQSLNASQFDLQDTDRGLVANTLRQLWDTPSASYVIYNDESPLPNSTYSSTFGHTKGVFATDGETGFWLTHSTPQFPLGPSYASSYEGITSNGFDYGQHYLCISLTATQVNTIAYQFQMNRPLITDSRISSTTPSELAALARGEYSTSPNCDQVTVRGATHDWVVFSKTTQWNGELYDACIAPTLCEPLRVESWMRGDECGPMCGKYSVVDIKSVEFIGNTWQEHQDHSKWAVGSRHVCFGDINRMKSQAARGGGAVCVDDSHLWEIMNGAAVSAGVCGGH